MKNPVQTVTDNLIGNKNVYTAINNVLNGVTLVAGIARPVIALIKGPTSMERLPDIDGVVEITVKPVKNPNVETTAKVDPADLDLINGIEGGSASPASVEELISMMNKREGVNARYAVGDEEAYLKAVDAEGSHMMMEDGTSDIIFRKDMSDRWTAYHEWLHKVLQNKNGSITQGEDTIIENFLERHKGVLKIERK